MAIWPQLFGGEASQNKPADLNGMQNCSRPAPYVQGAGKKRLGRYLAMGLIGVVCAADVAANTLIDLPSQSEDDRKTYAGPRENVPYTRCDLTDCYSSLGNISYLSNGTSLSATDFAFYAISGGSTLGNDKRALIQVSNGTAFGPPADIACGSAVLTTASFGTYIELNNGENCTLSWTEQFNGTQLSYSDGRLQRDSNGNYLLKYGTLAIDTAPTITGGDTLDINVEEGQTSVTNVAASDPSDRLTYGLSGGADQGKFAIDANTGALTFQTAPDHASPTDADTNNSPAWRSTPAGYAGAITGECVDQRPLDRGLG